MNLELFVDTYEAKKHTASGDEFVKEHITNEYVPYETKCDIAGAIIDTSYHEDYSDNSGKTSRKLYINSPSRYLLTCISVVDLYTDIKRDKTNSNILADFNRLNKAGLIDKIIANIPECEIDELNMVIDMTAKDLMTNEYEPHAFIREQISRFGELIGQSLAPVLQGIDWQKAENVVKQLAAEKLK